MKKKSIYFPLLLLLALVSLLWAPFTAAQALEGREYVVQADDWLSKIAEKEYGDLLAYPNIIKATNAKALEDDSFAVIDNPDVIEVGQKLWLPGAPEDNGDTVPKAQTAPESEATEEGFEDFDPDNFDDSTNIDNEWWPLKPGMQYIYEGFTVEDDEEIPHRIVFTVTDLTKVINGVRTVVIFDRDYSDDELEEAELAFFAQDKDGNVWHFGQYRETYDQVEFVGGRVWLVDLPEGAKAGIMMPAEPQLGMPSYSQGYAPAPFNWTDRARVIEMGQETSVEFDDYDDVLVIEEFNEEEPNAFQLKYYARGVGNVQVGWRGDDTQQEELELVDIVELSPNALAEVREEALELEKRAYMYAQTSPAEQMPY